MDWGDMAMATLELLRAMDVDQGILAEDVEEDEGIKAVSTMEWKGAVHT